MAGTNQILSSTPIDDFRSGYVVAAILRIPGHEKTSGKVRRIALVA